MHINELLSYASFYINNSTVDNIKTIISNFYSGEDIADAKKLLWEVANDKLGPMIERKSSSKRSCSEANIDDIFEGLGKLDASQSLPLFVAKNIDMIPSRQPEELNILSVLSRMSKVEKNCKVFEDLLKTHAIEIDQLKNDIVNTDTDISSKIKFHSENINENRNESEQCVTVESTLDESGDNDMLTPKTPTQYVSCLFDTPKTKQSNRVLQDSFSLGTNVKLQVQKLEKEYIENSSINRTTISRKTDKFLIDQDGFQSAESRYTRKRRIQAASLVGAPPPLRFVFVSRVEKGNVHSLFDFLRSENINVQRVERMSHIDAKFKSFKVSVFKNEVNKLLNNIEWPNGIVVRIWKNMSLDNDNSFNNKSNDRDNNIYKKSFYGRNINKSNKSFTGNLNREFFSKKLST